MSPLFISTFSRKKHSSRRQKVAVLARSAAHISPWVIGVVALAALILSYVWQVTLLATSGYERGSLERTRSALQEKISSLRVATVDEQALARVEERVREMQFVADEEPQYVTAAELARTLSRR